MRLLNVRLADEDAQLVRKLRERGISISTLVRGAIRDEARALPANARPDTDAILEEMRARFPAPAKAQGGARIDSSDRRQVQALVREKLRRRR